MFGSSVIDILIGLVVVFLAVGLTVSAGTEVFSHWLSLRPDGLKKALIGMLDGGASAGAAIPADHWFFGQALLRSMEDSRNTFPSYMDPKTFSEALLMGIDKDFASKSVDELTVSLQQSVNALAIDEGVRELLRSYIQQANGDVRKFRELVENWFDRVMDRTSGWYKRKVSIIGLILAAIIVVAANIDSLAIARALHGSDTLRAKMLEVADRFAAARPNPVAAVPNPAPSTGQDEERARRQLAELKEEFKGMQQAGLPLGWDGDLPTSWNWLTKFVGWLITICAAILGAPFWFDMLTKIVNIRSAGPKPLTRTEVVSPPIQAGEH